MREEVLQVDNSLSCCGQVHVYTYVHVCTRMYTYVHVCTRMYTYVHVCTRMYISAILFGVQQTRLEYCLSVLPCAYYHK